MAHKVRRLADVPSSENMRVLPQLGIHDCAEDTPIRDVGVAQVPLEDEHDASRVRTEKSTELFAPPPGLYGLRQIIRPLALSQPCATLGTVANITEREGRDRMIHLAFGEDLNQSAFPSVDRQRHGLWEETELHHSNRRQINTNGKCLKCETAAAAPFAQSLCDAQTSLWIRCGDAATPTKESLLFAP